MGKPTYASKAILKRSIAAAREAAIDVAGIQLFPDGSLRILEARALVKEEPESEFDRLEKAGLL